MVGSGPGDATVARELARKGRRVLMQGITCGGSSAINFAIAMAPPLPMFAAHGIDLAPALNFMQTQLPLAPLPDSLVGPMAKRISHAALALGYEWKKLNKMIYTDQCRTGCWHCVYRCPFGAKWTARNFIDDALAAGADIQTEARASRILTEHGRAVGVEYRQYGEFKQVFAANVVLAGIGIGIGSPQLLQASGLRTAVATHFSDPVIAVMGSVDDLESSAEVPMAGGMHLDQEGIMLADLTLPRSMYQAFAVQVGRIDRMFSHKRRLPIAEEMSLMSCLVAALKSDIENSPADPDNPCNPFNPLNPGLPVTGLGLKAMARVRRADYGWTLAIDNAELVSRVDLGATLARANANQRA